MATAARVLAAAVDVERAAAAVTDDIIADVWPAVEDPAFLAALGRSVHDDVRAIFGVLAGRIDIAVVPGAALEFADAAAHLAIPVAEIQRAYRADELDRTLGYSLADTHLALLIESDQNPPSATDIAALRDAADARGTLVVQHTARTWVVCVARASRGLRGRLIWDGCGSRSPRPGSRSRSASPAKA